MAGTFRFSFGPWNISEGSDPFGPPVRESVAFADKLASYKELGFGAVQFHDDDVVPDMDSMNASQIIKKAQEVRKMLDGEGLVTEFVAPRLWEDLRTIDGAFTSNDAATRKYAYERSKRTVDIARAMGTKFMVIWFAREGTYLREAKDSKRSVHYLVEALNQILTYDSELTIAIEPKPNEPMDQTYIPTTGHAIALGNLTADPKRMGVNIETAHAILAGLDPSDEMGFALACGKLFTVHLNDQNGLKFDEDKSFGSVDLRRAFNQVRILDKHDYGSKGEWIGLDVKAMRTQKQEVATKHLRNSKMIFERLLDLSRSLDDNAVERLISERDYEELDLVLMNHLMGQ